MTPVYFKMASDFCQSQVQSIWFSTRRNCPSYALSCNKIWNKWFMLLRKCVNFWPSVYAVLCKEMGKQDVILLEKCVNFWSVSGMHYLCVCFSLMCYFLWSLFDIRAGSIVLYFSCVFTTNKQVFNPVLSGSKVSPAHGFSKQYQL